MKKLFLITAGNLSLFLGIAGIFLPVLPTTPFLLLSATCYVRSSEKLYVWLINHRVFGLYVRSYILYRAISLRAKIISILALWIVMLSTILFFISLLWLRVLLFCIGLGVTVYLVHFKTLTAAMMAEIKEQQNSR